MLDTLEESAFRERLQETFVVEGEDGSSQDMKLVEVSTFSERSRMPERRLPFSTVFLAPKGVVLPQGIYKVRNETLGELQLFLVPLGPDAESTGSRHEAVFT